MTQQFEPVLIVPFILCVLLAVFGNLFVYFALLRARVPLRHLWAGTPGYLYRVCLGAKSTVNSRIRRLALTSSVAFVLALLLAVPLFILQPPDV